MFVFFIVSRQGILVKWEMGSYNNAIFKEKRGEKDGFSQRKTGRSSEASANVSKHHPKDG